MCAQECLKQRRFKAKEATGNHTGDDARNLEMLTPLPHSPDPAWSSTLGPLSLPLESNGSFEEAWILVPSLPACGVNKSQLLHPGSWQSSDTMGVVRVGLSAGG